MDANKAAAGLPAAEQLEGKSVRLLLGTDKHIGEDRGESERRVAVIPSQAAELSRWSTKHGIDLRLDVISCAGVGAGYPDDEYREVGCEILEEAASARLDPPPDIVHALKEPSSYEIDVPGPFLRIGALHTGDFDKIPAIGGLLRKQNFAAIFDGAAIGGVAYRRRGGFPIPLRSEMSVFAGQIAADRVVENLRKVGSGRAVVCGGGAVGRSAAERLLRDGGERLDAVVVIERNAERCAELRSWFADDERVRIVEDGSAGAHLEGVAGLILAAFTPGRRAPEVASVSDFASMAAGGMVVDVAVDEGGSIAGDKDRIGLDLASLGNQLVYVGDRHLPRGRPREASEVHGRTVLPYLAALVHSVAKTGGAVPAASYIAGLDVDSEPEGDFEAVLLDLKNGLAFQMAEDLRIYEVVKKRAVITQFLDEAGVTYRTL